jgi:hypothetical protein
MPLKIAIALTRSGNPQSFVAPVMLSNARLTTLSTATGSYFSGTESALKYHQNDSVQRMPFRVNAASPHAPVVEMTGVAVGAGVSVGAAVVGLGVGIAVGVAVGLGEAVGVAGGDGVSGSAVAVPTSVGVGAPVATAVGVIAGATDTQAATASVTKATIKALTPSPLIYGLRIA